MADGGQRNIMTSPFWNCNDCEVSDVVVILTFEYIGLLLGLRTIADQIIVKAAVAFDGARRCVMLCTSLGVCSESASDLASVTGRFFQSRVHLNAIAIREVERDWR